MARGRQLLLAALLALAIPAWAVDYRSVDVPVAVLYDSPSQKAVKLYLLKQYTPVELVVRLEGWIKVRDAEGTLAWIDARALSEHRTVVVTAPRAEVRKEASADAALAFEADKWVALDYVDAGPPGWIKVRHRDGTQGYVKVTQIWGL